MKIRCLVACTTALVMDPTSVHAFSANLRQGRIHRTSALDMAQVGIVYGTSTGSTMTVAEMIYEAFGSDVAAEPVDIETVDAGELAAVLAAHDALIVGTPTWNTGADTERSGTGWDDLYYSTLPEIKAVLNAKKVAVFGLGDQISYSDNYADATGELFDVFESLGCQMLGAWSQEGYEHDASKAIRGDKFCGLLLDMVNQEELTDERVEQWVAQLKAEGILQAGAGGGTVAAAPAPEAAPAAAPVNNVAASAPPAVTEPAEEWKETLEDFSATLDENIALHSSGGFTPHYNAKTGETMWTSADGHSSFVTTSEGVTAAGTF